MMMEKTLNELIREALTEARMLEYGREYFDEGHILEVAQRLSGAPYSFVEEVAEDVNA